MWNNRKRKYVNEKNETVNMVPLNIDTVLSFINQIRTKKKRLGFFLLGFALKVLGWMKSKEEKQPENASVDFLCIALTHKQHFKISHLSAEVVGVVCAVTRTSSCVSVCCPSWEKLGINTSEVNTAREP